VASGLDVSGRTNAPTVALTVSPRTVHRGHSVLVQGVAAGCTSGNAVTILSRAFAPKHSFAGVPAALAQVGSAGRFSTIVTIPRLRLPATYTVTARCGGGNLGVEAHLTVVR
jgi:phosphodiesterase/alkaline phosphatase D-like protein